MKDLFEKFVCVRAIKANDLDLTLFQFDYDLTFAAFFLNADKTIYGRYGSRSSREEAEQHLTTAGLAASMSAALKVHQEYPANKKYLAGKQAAATKFKTPDDYPSLRGKYKTTLNYQGSVAKSCLHCHQIQDAEREIFRSAGEPIPDEVLFPHPSPAVIGLSLDPRRRAKVTQVKDGSIAEKSGFRAGDDLLTLGGQSILSLADVQWVLHHAKSPSELPATVKRGDKIVRLTLTLDDDWRRRSDISWRSSTWPLRRMVTGGLILEPASPDQRRQAKAAEGELALAVKGMGRYGKHAVAMRAGFRKGDVVVSFNGQSQAMSPGELLAYGVQNTKPGERIPVVVDRGGRRLEMKLLMQD